MKAGGKKTPSARRGGGCFSGHRSCTSVRAHIPQPRLKFKGGLKKRRGEKKVFSHKRLLFIGGFKRRVLLGILAPPLGISVQPLLPLGFQLCGRRKIKRKLAAHHSRGNASQRDAPGPRQRCGFLFTPTLDRGHNPGCRCNTHTHTGLTQLVTK